MNNPVRTLTDTPTKKIYRTCPKCKNVRKTQEVICPICGESLQSVGRIRATGIFLVVMGVALLGFMSWLTVWMLNAYSQTGKFPYHGSPSQTAFIIFVVGLVVLISLNATAAGIWQVVFGRRSKALSVTMMILGVVFVAVGFAAFLSACGNVTGSNQMNATNNKSVNRLALAAATPVQTSEKAELPLDSTKISTVTYCELIKNAADYDQKIVRVRGVYFNGFERMFLYDEHCVKNEPPTAAKNIPAETWIEWDADFSRKDQSEKAKEYHAVKSGERKDVTIVGKFYAKRDINNTGSGKYLLRVMRVEKVSNLQD